MNHVAGGEATDERVQKAMIANTKNTDIMSPRGVSRFQEAHFLR